MSSSTEGGIAVVLFSILVLTDLIGNTLVILIILTNKSMKFPLNYLLLNLAVADILVGTFTIPSSIFGHFFSHPDGLKGIIICKILSGGNLAWIGGAVSVFCLVAICLDRYFAVMHPYSPNLKLTFQKVKRIVIACWIFSAIFNIPLFVVVDYVPEKKQCWEEWPERSRWLSKAYSVGWFTVAGFIPFVVMSCLYSRVIYNLWIKRTTNRVQGTQLSVAKTRKRVTKMVVIVSVLFCITWFPTLITYMLFQNLYYIPAEKHVNISTLLVLCNSAINPFVYAFQSQKFRRRLKELVCCRKFCTNRVSAEG